MIRASMCNRFAVSRNRTLLFLFSLRRAFIHHFHPRSIPHAIMFCLENADKRSFVVKRDTDLSAEYRLIYSVRKIIYVVVCNDKSRSELSGNSGFFFIGLSVKHISCKLKIAQSVQVICAIRTKCKTRGKIKCTEWMHVAFIHKKN